ncbi:MAG: winged helix DNA-binding domain-containing protein [Actinobacteria bacterium]|nr:winged helix DNA-binding domain-containing protein [Actinomycetota bacterium]
MRTISLARARRMAIAAQGLHRPRPEGKIDARHLRKVMSTIGVLQIDSVNVVARAHRLTLFSRLGNYDPDLLQRVFVDRRELFEYWAHEASLVPMDDWPLFRHRMAGMPPWGAVQRIEQEHPGFMDQVLGEVGEHGPLAASDLSQGGGRKGNWWGWSDGKLALEWLFASGRVTVSHRRNFTRYYDLPERVIPAETRALPVPEADEARKMLLTKGAASMGVGTARDLADYYRINIKEARPLVEELADGGLLERVQVEGWSDDAFVHPGAANPRSVEGRALLCPFDSLVWYRERTQRLFGFHYRIEIYVPEPKRVHGYYVFPFLLGDDLVARVDLKADRAAGVLRARGAFLEEGRDPVRAASALAAELAEMAAWLGLGEVSVEPRGDLAGPLQKAV